MRTRTGVGMLVLAAALACGTQERATSTTGARSAPPNQPPTLHSVRLVPSEPAPGQRVRAEVRARDPENDALRFGYVWSVAGRRVPGGEAELEVPPAAKGEAIEVVVTASDGRADSAPARARGRVGNRPPELRALVLEPGAAVAPGAAVVATVDAEDPDGEPVTLRFRWQVNGDPVEAGGPRFVTTGLRRGDTIDVRVTASDGEDQSEPLTSAPVRIANAVPVIRSQPGGLSRDGRFRYQVEARDPDDASGLRYRLVSGPPGMQIDSVLGEVVWEPDATAAGTHTVEVAVADPHGGEARQRFEVTVRERTEAPAPGPASAGP